MGVKTHRLLMAVIAFVALIGGCVGVVVVHDNHVRLSENEFRGRIASNVKIGAGEADVTAFLNSLEASDRSDEATITHRAAEVVSAVPCGTARCLLDEGVQPGDTQIAAYVENFGQWRLDVCTDRYVVFFVFDASKRFSKLVIMDASHCL
jgi:hypothetical protein